ncbi:calpain-3-like [Sardina pilchardus]|uniref:calpain-3-like n=1 Tax=Sardina pilchardus TaxID=27697 RepID=UPI002E145258
MPPPGVCLNILNDRQRKEGRGSDTNPVPFLDQDFKEIHQYCLKNGYRYRDEMFPPDYSSIGDGLLKPNDLARVVWQRAGALVKDPCFILGGVSRFDFRQGRLGNCWFLAAIGALTFQDDIKKQIIPEEQSFQKDYAGMFHFRFWRFGKWVDVVIDDKLPTIDGRLIFVNSGTNELWAVLMEKAYAKVCGSYADMNAGTVAEALKDFTGGIHLTFKLDEASPDLWDIMFRAARSKSLMGCGTPQGATSDNTVLPNGIVQGHAYAITGITQVMSNNRPVRLVRLFNPWGHGEWKGDWSDKSSKWQTVSPEDRMSCLSIREDGEFWMSMEDFCKSYSDMDICSMNLDFLSASTDCHWTCKSHEGRWVTGTTAGGCMNNRESFWINPQYHIKLEALKGESANDNKNLVVSLMQKSDKRNRHLASNFGIGFAIFSPSPTDKLNDNNSKVTLFKKYTDQYEEVDAEQLQRLLNENLLQGNSSGFGLDTCRSMVALMDLSVTGHLNRNEFLRLWDRVVSYKEIFYRTDVSRTGDLSLSELRNALIATGVQLSDGMLNLLALRYGGSKGNLTLESFVHLILRFECMSGKNQNAVHLICLSNDVHT